MRSIYKGAVAFGLVNVPVKVYSATEDNAVKFHQAHATDRGRIRMPRMCEECGEIVAYQDIAKMYEAEDGTSVIITEDDLATLPIEKSREIEVLQFVRADEIDPMMWDRSYFLGPDGKNTKAYQLLAAVLDEIDHYAIVQITMRSKTRMAALRTKRYGQAQVLMLHTLLWPDELRQPEFPTLSRPAGYKPAELKVAHAVVESMIQPYDPADFTDEYRRELMELVQAKLEGATEAFPVADQAALPAATEEVDDLLAKLTASVAARALQGDPGKHARV